MLKKLFGVFLKKQKTSRQPERHLAEIEECLRNLLCERICLLTAQVVKDCQSGDNEKKLKEAMANLNQTIARYVRAVRICDRSAAGEEIGLEEICSLRK